MPAHVELTSPKALSMEGPDHLGHSHHDPRHQAPRRAFSSPHDALPHTAVAYVYTSAPAACCFVLALATLMKMAWMTPGSQPACIRSIIEGGALEWEGWACAREIDQQLAQQRQHNIQQQCQPAPSFQ